MCDTLVRRESGQTTLFAKNSDRHPLEPQLFEFTDASLDSVLSPRIEKYGPQFATLQKAILELKNPYQALISRPTWIWGAETGVNEKGVVIGNEAVFTKEPTRSDGLLGMDIVRLTLHNSATAKKAVDLIITLLEKWGQGGDGSFKGKLAYSNSFLVADRSSAFVVETAGERWAVKSVDTYATISNAYSLASDYQRSDKKSEGHDFANTYADRFMEFFSKGRERQATTMLLTETADHHWMGLRDVLRYNRGSDASLDRSMRSICIDAALPKPTRTTTSMVVEYPEALIMAWYCSNPMPCYHPFLPFVIVSEPPADLGQTYESAQRRQRLSATLLKADRQIKEEAARSARALDERFEARMRPLLKEGDLTALQTAVATCIKEAAEREEALCARLGLS
ncbi:MAG: hypothetical protein GX938_02245 [Spirochaetales bacterium]|nr:hypothetical protein [Spirochaetales bacterium]